MAELDTQLQLEIVCTGEILGHLASALMLCSLVAEGDSGPMGTAIMEAQAAVRRYYKPLIDRQQEALGKERDDG